MCADSRTDSLAARLKRAEIFDEYFGWWLSQRPSFAERLEWLDLHGCATTAGALSRLHRSSEASVWRMAEAAKAREVMDKNLPKDLDETIRKALKDARFSEVLGEISHEMLMDHLKVEHDTATLKLKEKALRLKTKEVEISQERLEIQTCEKFIEWMRDEVAKGIASGSLSNSEKISRLRKRFFADVDQLEASGKVVLPK